MSILLVTSKGSSMNNVMPKVGRGHYQYVFLILKSIRILTKSLIWGWGGEVKMANLGVT